jgi:phospholipid/cholesterol/gamma-HCH transport system substrate-binding protein
METGTVCHYRISAVCRHYLFCRKAEEFIWFNLSIENRFKSVSGLEVGNNVRFSGINIGTVDEIELITDTSVLVALVIRKEFQQFIKTDAAPVLDPMD